MKLQSIAVLLLIMSLYFIVAAAAEHLTNSKTHPMSVFSRMLLGMLATGVTALLIHIDVPE